MKISILIDNPNSWMNDYVPELIRCLKKYDSSPVFLRKSSELKKRDVLFILSCNKILKRNELLLHKNNIVVHASDLPKDRGWSPMSWQVERGRNAVPLTLFEASEKLDSGDYYSKSSIRLDGTELVDEIRNKLAKKIIRMIEFYLERYPLKARPQKGKSTYNRRRSLNDCKLDINKALAGQFNKMRIADNESYPLYFVRKNKKYILKIYKA